MVIGNVDVDQWRGRQGQATEFGRGLRQQKVMAVVEAMVAVKATKVVTKK